MPTLDERVTALEVRLDRLQSEQDQMALDMSKLPAAIGVNFRVFTRSVEAKFAAVDRRFEALEAKVDGLGARFNGLDAKVDSLSSDVSAILEILGRHFGPRT